jgi:heme oxygenase
LLIAHAYTRYLGDLSGGQILKRLARGGMQLPEGKGTAFYEFTAIPDAKAFKRDYRKVLNSLPLDSTTCEQIVAEANLAFGLNMALFQELEGSLLRAIGKAAFNRLVRRHGS